MPRFVLCLLGIVCLGWADSLTLRDGRVVTGSFLGGDTRQVRLVVGEKVETFALSEVARIEFGAAATIALAGPVTVASPGTTVGIASNVFETKAAEPAVTGGTLNGVPALVAIVAAAPNVEKAPESIPNPFLPKNAKPAATGLASSRQTPIEGNPDSPVRVVAYEDLQCPDCATYRRMLDEKLLPAYKDRVAFEHRDFPLAKHAWARPAAAAARFFQEINPEIGVEYRRYALANRSQITTENFKERLAQFAKEHGVDPAKAAAAPDEARYQELVDRDLQDGVARGVSKTPTVFVNGQPFVETFSFEELSKAIEAALNR
ncbi:MAG: thioredoxin domain-containing protein [Acidobacteria bacterium]|nr:thioredoxin domain-containing protein [Acidobacteriota bacterium]